MFNSTYLFVFLLLLAGNAIAQSALHDQRFNSDLRANTASGNKDMYYQRSWEPPNYDSLHKGKPYQAFDIATLDGRRLTNETCRGKVTFISFWFESCGGCREEFPQVNELYDSLKNDPWCQFVAVTFDSPGELPAFVAKYGLRFPIAAISQQDFKRLNFGMASPGLVILDKDANVGFAGIRTLVKDERPGKYSLSIAQALSIIRSLE